jgi:hypothetical protein
MARRKMASFLEFRNKWFELNEDKDPNSFRNAFYLNFFYMVFAGGDLLDRYDGRDERIRDMMAKDEAKDAQLAEARLTTEPVCAHCGKSGLRIIDKTLLRRDGHGDVEQVIIMLKCPSCEKNSAYWEDGERYELRCQMCPKCGAEMSEKNTRGEKQIITTYSCSTCGHTFKDKLNLTVKKDKADPAYEADRALYCLQDKKNLEDHRDARARYEGLARLAEEWKEKEDNKELYDAVASVQKLKIAQLHDLLKPALEAAGYIEIRFAEPEIKQAVVVGVSCLDGDSKREGYDSRKALKKAIVMALEQTNWRLLDGVDYRLGYLNGRVQAYEREEDLIKLVQKKLK